MERIGMAVGSAVDLLSTRSSLSGTRANEIVPIIDAGRLPPLRSWEVDHAERFVVFPTSVNGKDGGGHLTLARLLNDKAHSALEYRVCELQRAIEPCREDSRDRLLGAISGMLGSFPTMQRYDKVTALSIAAAYLWTVRERPPWAIIEACNLVRGGEAWPNRSYCPSEGQFNHLIKQRVAPYVDALRRARQLLNADILPEPKPRLSREEIEAKLGRELSKPLPSDRGCAGRAFSDLETRKIGREGTDAATIVRAQD